jgi:hypothetical protein
MVCEKYRRFSPAIQTRDENREKTKTGKVTINGKPNETLTQELLNSIWKQAGWK